MARSNLAKAIAPFAMAGATLFIGSAAHAAPAKAKPAAVATPVDPSATDKDLIAKAEALHHCPPCAYVEMRADIRAYERWVEAKKAAAALAQDCRSCTTRGDNEVRAAAIAANNRHKYFVGIITGKIKCPEQKPHEDKPVGDTGGNDDKGYIATTPQPISSVSSVFEFGQYGFGALHTQKHGDQQITLRLNGIDADGTPRIEWVSRFADQNCCTNGRTNPYLAIDSSQIVGADEAFKAAIDARHMPVRFFVNEPVNGNEAHSISGVPSTKTFAAGAMLVSLGDVEFETANGEIVMQNVVVKVNAWAIECDGEIQIRLGMGFDPQSPQPRALTGGTLVWSGEAFEHGLVTRKGDSFVAVPFPGGFDDQPTSVMRNGNIIVVKSQNGSQLDVDLAAPSAVLTVPGAAPVAAAPK